MNTGLVGMRRIAASVVVLAAVGVAPAFAQSAAAAAQTAPGASYGPGMMRGYHQGMMRGSGTGYRMGPGMMGGYSMGPGMMGDYGMGPGMMGSYGMGPGMMGSYGMGPGMMGSYGMGPGMMAGYGMEPGRMVRYQMMYGYGAHVPGLSTDQREKIADIRNDAMNQAWPIMGRLRERYFEFSRLMAAEAPDRGAIHKVYGQISDLKRQLLDIRLQTRERIMGVLSKDQRKAMHRTWGHREWWR